MPIGIGLDQRTRTLYVADVVDKTLSVIDATRCNARLTAGCAALARVPLEGDPLGLVIDDVTDTVYVGNGSINALAVIDGRTCNRVTPSACPAAAISAATGAGPVIPSLDRATRTLYVGNFADGTVSVLDVRTCNGQVTTGCAQTPPTLTAGNNPLVSFADPATHTLYVANDGDNTVSVFDTATCNASVTSGCGQVAPTTIPGSCRAAASPSTAQPTACSSARGNPTWCR